MLLFLQWITSFPYASIFLTRLIGATKFKGGDIAEVKVSHSRAPELEC